MPSGQDAVSRLRDEAYKALATHCMSFEEELRTLQGGLAASISTIDQVSQRLVSVRSLDTGNIESVLEEAVAEAERAQIHKWEEERSILAHFAHEIRTRETQEEILTLLLDSAHRYAPGIVLFVARAQQFIEWSSRGFSGDGDANAAGSALGFSESSLLRGALNADGLTTADDISGEKALARLLPETMKSPWHAFPLKAIGRPVAVLLASPLDGGHCDLESLCVLMDLTGLCVENMALKVLHEARASAPAAPPPAAAEPPAPETTIVQAPSEAEIREEEISPELPAAVVEEVPVEVEAEAPAPAAVASEFLSEDLPEGAPSEAAPAEAAPDAEFHFEPPTGDAEPEPELPEAAEIALPDHAVGEPDEPKTMVAEVSEMVPALEEPTPAAEAAMVAAEPPDAGVEKPEPVRPAGLREVQPLTEEEKLHADAKRFARLLASEIKLYNEQRVQEGRVNRDLYVRLKRDIDRSRDMYEKRVSPLVARRVDYFHDEIVRVLGENDPSTLGSDYPGPRVES